MNDRLGEPRHNQAAVWSACEGRNRAFHLASVAQHDRGQLHPKQRRHRLDRIELGEPSRVGRVIKDGRAGQAGSYVLKQRNGFGAQSVFGVR